MKKIVSLVSFSLIISITFASREPYKEVRTLYQHLVAINSNWAKYITEDGIWKEKVAFADDHSLVSTDLFLVEEFLRSRDVSGLSAELQEARERNLDEFHAYIVAGNFPVNYDHEERRPCFIDKDGGVCAVGNLLVRSGQQDLAHYIAANYEYAYVHEMGVEQLAEWQKHSGLTAAELDLVQPSYGWKNSYSSTGINAIGLVYGVNVVSINTHRNIFSSLPESYRHMYSYSYGVSLSRAIRKNKMLFETGCYFISDQYLHTVEGNLGPNGQYGKILTEFNPEYIGIPVFLGFGDMRSESRSMVKLGYRADIFQDLRSTMIPIGVNDPKTLMEYTIYSKGYSKVRHNLLLNFSFDHQMDMGKQRMWVHFEPAISFQLNNDQTDHSILGYKPVVLALNTGVNYNIPQNPKHNQRKADRKKRRDAKKVRKQQLKDKKKKEQEEKERKKEEKK
jgi:hypothetical protein